MTLQPLFIDGKPLRLGQRIGKGGEGEVFALADEPSRAVKLYTIADLATREAKVAAMLRKNLAASSGNIAFPVAAVRDKAGRFKGFLMPLVRGHLPIFELYSPGARKQSFPKADYRFLVRAALNAARAVAAVHKAGCVIGDINHSGILISGESATAALIDADSFQVVDGVERYLCRVGVPDYTPPELQGISLSSVVRTPNHDAFGLAIVVFLMLAMGRHPFVGRYTKGEMPIEKAIAEFRFAFSQMRDVGMTPPPGANSLMDFTPSVAAAFESAFSRTSRDNRPTSSQWVSLLEEFERSLRPCTDNRLHSYSSTASACPWCRMEKALRIALFLPDYTGGFTDPSSAVVFNLAVLWAQVEAVRLPLSNQLTPKVSSLSPQPSATAQAARRKQTKPSLYRIAGLIAGGVIIVAAPQLWLLALGATVGGFMLANGQDDARSSLSKRFTEIEQAWNDALDDWERRAGLAHLEQLKASLGSAKREYERLPNEEAQRIASYQAKRQSHQRSQYLEKYRIRDFRIHGVGATRLATLASYGFETAADLEQRNVLEVPGFGPNNSKPLIEWVAKCAQGFRYNPNPTPVDSVEIARIKNDIARGRQDLEQRIAAGAGAFLQRAHVFKQMSEQEDPAIAAVHVRRVQVEVDLKFLGFPLPQRPTRVARRVVQPKSPISVITGPMRTVGKGAATAAPTCPNCQGQMVRRTARRGWNKGNSFWGCARYPACSGTRT